MNSTGHFCRIVTKGKYTFETILLFFFLTKITIERFLNSNLSVVFQMRSLFAKALKQRDTSIPFGLIVPTSSRVCQCPERFLERACDHMDCYRINYRYAFTFENKAKSYYKPNRNNYWRVISKPKPVLN